MLGTLDFLGHNSDLILYVSQQNDKSVTTAESRVFWLGLVICPLIWMLFLVAALFSLKFKWLVSLFLLLLWKCDT